MKNIQKNESACADESSPGAFEAFRGGAVPPQATKVCANPTCKKEFVPLRKQQQYCSTSCAKRMHKYGQSIEYYFDKPCEQCHKDHDHKYGSGRFCSRECKDAFVASTKRGAKNPKVKAHLDKLRNEGKVSVKAKFGTWKCSVCNKIFETRNELNTHIQSEHGAKIHSVKHNGKNICPYCNKEFESGRHLGGHISNCKMHPNKVQHDLAHKQGGKTLSIGYKSGRLVNKHKGYHHTNISKQHMREAACRYLQKINATPCRYNKSSIKILEQIAKEHGWNIQHAENGGEFYTGIGYFVDAYDKEKNIVLEYDEPVHYVDVENNILREKDLKRQQEIIEHLHCEYWRFNEKMKLLWKVE